MKTILREKSKDVNLIKRMKERQFQGCQIEIEEQNDFYQSLLGDLEIKDDQEDSFDLKNTNYEHESNLSKQISDSEIFNTRKKQKKNDKEEEKGEDSKCKKICSQNSDENDLVENIEKFQIMSEQNQK